MTFIAREDLLALFRRQARIGQPLLQVRELSGSATALKCRRIRRAALEIIEVEQHRRAVRGGAQHVPEIAQHVRPNRFALVLGQVLPHLALTDEDVEMIEPEVHQDFLQLPFG
jgi:hypothetical protein